MNENIKEKFVQLNFNAKNFGHDFWGIVFFLMKNYIFIKIPSSFSIGEIIGVGFASTIFQGVFGIRRHWVAAYFCPSVHCTPRIGVCRKHKLPFPLFSSRHTLYAFSIPVPNRIVVVALLRPFEYISHPLFLATASLNYPPRIDPLESSQILATI